MIKVWRRSRDPKKGSGDEAFSISRGFAARGGSAANSHSTGTAAPPPNLPRLVHNTASYAGCYKMGHSTPHSFYLTELLAATILTRFSPTEKLQYVSTQKENLRLSKSSFRS